MFLKQRDRIIYTPLYVVAGDTCEATLGSFRIVGTKIQLLFVLCCFAVLPTSAYGLFYTPCDSLWHGNALGVCPGVGLRTGTEQQVWAVLGKPLAP